MIDEDIDFEFPEDELDYYLKLQDEIQSVGKQLVAATDPEEKECLTRHLIQLREWSRECIFDPYNDPDDIWMR
jgi:hypothetical protein